MMLVAIIDLIYLICITAMRFVENSDCLISNQQTSITSASLFLDFAESLNSQGREEVLLNCLVIPVDKVRLAVVKCLCVVPIDQLDESEIEGILKTITNCTNINVGETELVMALVYQICCKLVSKEAQQKECGKIF